MSVVDPIVIKPKRFILSIADPSHYVGLIRIRLYSNRKLYLEGTHLNGIYVSPVYVKFEFIKKCVAMDKEFIISDAYSGEDLTKVFLERILAQEYFKSLSDLPLEEIKFRLKELTPVENVRETMPRFFGNQNAR